MPTFRSLGAKAAALVVSLCVVSCAVLLVLSHFALKADADLDMSKDALAARGRAQDVLAKIGHRVETYASIYATHPEVVAAVQSGDKAKLRETFVRLFAQIKQLDPVIGTLEVTDAISPTAPAMTRARSGWSAARSAVSRRAVFRSRPRRGKLQLNRSSRSISAGSASAR